MATVELTSELSQAALMGALLWAAQWYAPLSELPNASDCLRIRESAGVSRVQLAAAIGASENTLYRLESGVTHSSRRLEGELAYRRVLAFLKTSLGEER